MLCGTADESKEAAAAPSPDTLMPVEKASMDRLPSLEVISGRDMGETKELNFYYFDIGGRADPTRLMFKIGQVPFNDIRITGEQRKAIEEAGNCPFGGWPVLEVGGVWMAQSMSLLRYAARLGGLYPMDPIKGVQVDMVCDTVEDMWGEMARTIKVKSLPENQGKSEEDIAAIRAVMRKHLNDVSFPKYLKNMENVLQKNPEKSGYFVGSSITGADVAVFCMVKHLQRGIMDGIDPKIIETHAPSLVALHDNLAKNEAVAKYYEEFPNGRSKREESG